MFVTKAKYESMKAEAVACSKIAIAVSEQLVAMKAERDELEAKLNKYTRGLALGTAASLAARQQRQNAAH